MAMASKEGSHCNAKKKQRVSFEIGMIKSRLLRKCPSVSA